MDEVQFLHLAHIYTKLRDFGGVAAPVAGQDGRVEGEAHMVSPPRTTNPRHHNSSDSVKPADEDFIEVVVPKLPEKKLHHLTRHWLTSDEKGAVSMNRLGASSPKEAEHMIRSMGQRELRDGFKKVYGSNTSSYNNTWLRRKLYEAIGLNGTSGKRGRRRSNKMQRQSSKQAKTKSIAAEETAAEALAEIAAGEPKSSHLGGTNMPSV